MPNPHDIGTPAEWDLPPKFKAFRAQQARAITELTDCPTRVRVGNQPVGGGKSLTAMGLHRLIPSRRTIVLTANKGLQEQYLEDFESIGMFDIRGRNNYTCAMIAGDCERGYLASCPSRNISSYTPVPPERRWDETPDPCPYAEAYEQALRSELLISNYHYWIAIHQIGKTLGKFDLLICDEAHDLPSILSDMSMHAVPRQRMNREPSTDEELEDLNWWRTWAAEQPPVVLPDPAQDPHGYLDAERWQSTLKAIESATDDWVPDRTKKGYSIGPIWPAREARTKLFQSADNVVLLSATATPKTIELLGMKPARPLVAERWAQSGEPPPEDAAIYYEYASEFDPGRSPIYIFDKKLTDQGVRLNYKTRDDHDMLRLWVSLIDGFIHTRQDRKLLIHSVSYQWARIILELSRFRERMITHSRAHEIPWTLERFERASEPLVLVTPSMSTGYDFPHDACRGQIISKLPYPNNQEQLNLAKRRKQEDPEYDSQLVAQALMQAVGRGMRDEKDWCETAIVDKMFSDWFYWKNRHLFTKTFQDAVRPVRYFPNGQQFEYARRAA